MKNLLTKKVLNSDLLVFIFFLSIFIIFSNARITTSMDVDVLRAAQNFIETGSYGATNKLSSGVTFSPKTSLFYPQEAIGVVSVFSIP